MNRNFERPAGGPVAHAYLRLRNGYGEAVAGHGVGGELPATRARERGYRFASRSRSRINLPERHRQGRGGATKIAKESTIHGKRLQAATIATTNLAMGTGAIGFKNGVVFGVFVDVTMLCYRQSEKKPANAPLTQKYGCGVAPKPWPRGSTRRATSRPSPTPICGTHGTAISAGARSDCRLAGMHHADCALMRWSSRRRRRRAAPLLSSPRPWDWRDRRRDSPLPRVRRSA
jgi:hypothetical protein